MARGSRGARRPQPLEFKCPTCAAPPMEWCWTEKMLPKGSKPNGFACRRPDMEMFYAPADFLHEARRRARGSRKIVRKSPGPHDSLVVQVFFRGYGTKKIDVIKVIRAFLHIGLKEAKRVSESGPAVIAEMPKDKAGLFTKALREQGAEVEVRERRNG